METSVLILQNGLPDVKTQLVDIITDQVSVDHGISNGT